MGLEKILYGKKALGLNGKPFTAWKITTMHPDANERLEEVFEAGLDGLGKAINDNRSKSPFHRWLREHFIDETPQIYNMLRREMRLVGVRPRESKRWKDYPEGHKEEALHYKPGLMGVQYATHDVSERSFEEGVAALEAEYLRQKKERPIWTDVKYFFKITYNILFRGLRSK